MSSFLHNHEIWFLTGSQDLYGEETLIQVAQQSQRIVETLNQSGDIPAKVVWKPVLKDSDSIRRAILDAGSHDEVLGVITWMHTFSPAKMWISGLNVLTKPMLHLNTQANVDLPWDTIDFDFMNLNQSAHGDREFGYILSRLSVARETVVGHVDHAPVRERIATWVRAAAGWAATHDLKVVRFGDNMRNVAVTEGDKTEAEKVFGVSVNTWGVGDLVAVVDSVSDSDIDALVQEYEDLYEVAAELRQDGQRHDSLRYAARQEIGMERFLTEQGAWAFTDTFEDLGGLRQLPGIAAQRLMAKGYGFGAEGDWKTAVLVRAVKAMSEGLPGGASLMEDYTYNLTPGGELILGAHMLEICPTLTAEKPRVEIHPLDIGGREDPVRMVFHTDPGEGVLVSLADMGTRFRLTANIVDIIKPPQKMPHLPVAHAVWKPRPSLQTSAECWLQSGGSHHTVLTTSVGIDVFRIFSELAATELAVIDENSTVRGFTNELRWNQAYYHLARGL